MRKLSMYIVINVQAGESEKNYIEEIEELKRIIQTKNILIQRELTNKTMMFEQINSIVNENNKLKKILKENFNEVNINAIYDKQDLKGKVIDEEEETNENDNIIEEVIDTSNKSKNEKEEIKKEEIKEVTHDEIKKEEIKEVTPEIIKKEERKEDKSKE